MPRFNLYHRSDRQRQVDIDTRVTRIHGLLWLVWLTQLLTILAVLVR
jgi:hypothetical protein